jgi:uncharacterized protein YllA (UPF0747 family)
MGDAYKILKKTREKYEESSQNLELIKKEMKRSLKNLGILTKKVKINIDNLENGVVESGQQPMVLGGPSLILNKIAYCKSLCLMGKDNFVPLFYVADYDGVQAELTNIRVPSTSARGLLISYPTETATDDAPIRELLSPSEDWLKNTLDKVTSNYRGILKGVESSSAEKILMRLTHAISLIKHAYFSTDNVSDWSTKILGSLVNLENDLGVPFLIASKPGIRELFKGGYEELLAEPNRTAFIAEVNKSADLLEKFGYVSRIGKREDDYVPFYYECRSSCCKCSSCDQDYTFSYNSKRPDISDIVRDISPRVDSRQVIVDSVIPILAHVGGPGETGYYAQVIPGIKKLGLPLPIFLRYNRTFYNTMWNEKYEKRVSSLGYPTLLSNNFFTLLNSWVKARNGNNATLLQEAHEGIQRAIQYTFTQLVNETNSIQAEIKEIKQKLRNPTKRLQLIKELKTKQNTVQEIELYLSSVFGRFSLEKFGQEVNWLWLDLAIMSGLDDVMGVFLRQYNENTPNSSMYFVNLS